MLINIHLKDSKMTKKEKKLYEKNYSVFLSDNDKKITANRQIYLNKDGINELTGINCHKMENKHVLKRLKV